MIKTAEDVKWARSELGMSINELSDALRLSPQTGNRAIRRWESGDIPITGPAAVAIEAMLAGFEPEILHDNYEKDVYIP